MERCRASSSFVCRMGFGCTASGDKYGLYPDSRYERQIPEGPFPNKERSNCFRNSRLLTVLVSTEIFLLLIR